jgi:inosine-uridine nucleoside N-ribohydrolase
MYYCWLDSDPGHDDAFAILLASHSQNIKLLGISTTNGNQTIEKTTNNALKALNIFGKITNPTVDSNQIDFKNSRLNLNDSLSHGGLACPVIKGMSKPLLRPGKICDEIHGDSGLDAHVTLDFPTLPECAQKYVENINSQHEAQHFTTQIFNCLKNAPQKITLIATGKKFDLIK